MGILYLIPPTIVSKVAKHQWNNTVNLLKAYKYEPKLELKLGYEA